MSTHLQPIEERLGRVRGRLRRLFLLDGLARLLMAACLFAAVSFGLDYWLVLPAEVRIVLLGAGLLWVLWILWRRVIYPLRVRITADDLALLVEREYPDLHDRLISAIQLSRLSPTGSPDEASPQLIDRLIQDAVEASGSLAFDRIILRRYIALAAGLAVALVGVLGGLAVMFPDEAGVYSQRVWGKNVRWPQTTFLKVLGFDEVSRKKVMARGDSLDIDVEVLKGRPGDLVIDYRFEEAEAGQIDMHKQQDGTYRGTFDRVSGPFTFKVRGGDAETDVYTVETLTPPVVESLRIWYEYPTYTRKLSTPRDTPEMGGNIVTPVHTKVTIDVLSNVELQNGTLILGTDKKGAEEKISMKPVADADRSTRLRGEFVVREDLREYQVHVLATNGLDNHKGMIRYTIKPQIDQAPQIKMLDPVSDEDITEIAVRPMSVLTTDEYGVAEVKLVLRVATRPGANPEERKFGPNENTPPEYGGTSIRSQAELDISKLGVKPGDIIEYHYEAVDTRDIGGPNVGKTTPNRFRILSQTDLEKILEGMINEIKRDLEAQKKEEIKLLSQNREARPKLSGSAEPSVDQRNDLRGFMLRQNSLTQRVDSARKKVIRVLRMGTYNRVFNETSIQKLERVQALLFGISGDENKPGTSELAGQFLQTATKVKDGGQRLRAMTDADRLQDGIVQDLTRALELLDEWSTYQEVVRIVRELYQNQKTVNEDTRKVFGGNDNR